MRRYSMTRTDANHQALTEVYRQYGCSVVDLSSVGLGCPDVLIGAAGITDLVEFKMPDGELESNQVTFAERWRGSAVWVIRTPADVDLHVANMRRRARVKR